MKTQNTKTENTGKALLKGILVAVNAYMKKKYQINNLIFHLKTLENKSKLN